VTEAREHRLARGVVSLPLPRIGERRNRDGLPVIKSDQRRVDQFVCFHQAGERGWIDARALPDRGTRRCWQHRLDVSALGGKLEVKTLREEQRERLRRAIDGRPELGAKPTTELTLTIEPSPAFTNRAAAARARRTSAVVLRATIRSISSGVCSMKLPLTLIPALLMRTPIRVSSRSRVSTCASLSDWVRSAGSTSTATPLSWRSLAASSSSRFRSRATSTRSWPRRAKRSA